jgi:hypothetical protein
MAIVGSRLFATLEDHAYAPEPRHYLAPPAQRASARYLGTRKLRRLMVRCARSRAQPPLARVV